MSGFYYTSLAVFVIYIVTILVVFGLRKSISDSSYALKMYNAEIFFTLFCWGVSFPLVIYWIEFSQTDWNFLPALACGMLGFVGASPMYQNDSMENKVHNVGSYTCAVAAYLWAFIWGDVTVALIAIVLTLSLLPIKNHKVYFIEMVAFINLFIQIFPR